MPSNVCSDRPPARVWSLWQIWQREASSAGTDESDVAAKHPATGKHTSNAVFMRRRMWFILSDTDRRFRLSWRLTYVRDSFGQAGGFGPGFLSIAPHIAGLDMSLAVQLVIDG